MYAACVSSNTKRRRKREQKQRITKSSSRVTAFSNAMVSLIVLGSSSPQPSIVSSMAHNPTFSADVGFNCKLIFNTTHPKLRKHNRCNYGYVRSSGSNSSAKKNDQLFYGAFCLSTGSHPIEIFCLDNGESQYHIQAA